MSRRQLVRVHRLDEDALTISEGEPAGELRSEAARLNSCGDDLASYQVLDDVSE